MNPLWTQIIIQTALRTKQKEKDKTNNYSAAELAAAWKELKINAIRLFKDFILITLGVFSAAFGFKGFLLTNHFIDGGATGIS
jgi:hypothetical protein